MVDGWCRIGWDEDETERGAQRLVELRGASTARGWGGAKQVVLLCSVVR
jgi:hypothetical protein